MRDARKVFIVAAVLEKRLNANICVMQTDRYTAWFIEDRGFAIGPTIDSYPLGKLVGMLTKYFTPPKPVRLKDIA